jgi:hypothetical protein
MKNKQSNPTPYKIQLTDNHQVIFNLLTLGLDDAAIEVLKMLKESWMVKGLALECGSCHGSGKAQDNKGDCPSCQGRGWQCVGQCRQPH